MDSLCKAPHTLGPSNPPSERPPSWRRLLALIPESPLPPEKIFLVVGLVTGLVFLFVTPAFRGADEPAHWFRAYHVSEGGILAERQQDRVGALLPTSLYELSRPAPAQGVWLPLRPHDRTFIDFRNTVVFTPLPYLPHALAIGVGSALELPPIILFYVSRLAGLAAALALGFFAIRITPIAKRVFLLLALTPMAIRQMSLITADSVTNGASLLFLALLLRLALDRSVAATGWSITRLVVCSLAVSLSKIAYFPLALLYALCPVDKLGGRRRYAVVFLILVGLNVVAVAGWFWAMTISTSRSASRRTPTRGARWPSSSTLPCDTPTCSSATYTATG